MKRIEVLLSEVADINPKYESQNSIPSDSFVSFVPMSAISEKNCRIEAEEERPLREVAKGYTPFQNGDVLIAKITPCFENGKIALAKIKHPIGFGSTEFHVIRSNPLKLDSRYIYHFLRQGKIRGIGKKRMTGSVGQQRVPVAFFSNLQIPLPSLEEQRRISAVLDKADELRAKRRAALARLDTLLQSIFLDMFGDPVTNPKGFRVEPLVAVCKRITDGTHQPPKWANTGIPFLFVSNVIDGELDFNVKKFISLETFNKLNNRCPIEKNDILYTIVGSYGNAAMVETGQPFSFQRHIAHLKPNELKINPYFLLGMLQSPGVKRQADIEARGIAQKTLNLKELKQLKIFVPPIEDQKRYAAIRANIINQKSHCKNSLKLVDNLFHSLQQRAFNGRL